MCGLAQLVANLWCFKAHKAGPLGLLRSVFTLDNGPDSSGADFEHCQHAPDTQDGQSLWPVNQRLLSVPWRKEKR